MNIVWPGPARIALVLLAAIPAALAYPWDSTRERWVLGVGIAVLVVLLGWWRGLHLSSIARRRMAMLRHHRGAHAGRPAGSDVRTSVLLRVVSAPTGAGVLPLALIVGYLNRYGLRAETVRLTSRESGTDEASGDTWISLTFSAARNLPALQARAARIPLQDTAEVAARRLADHLRETGWDTVLVDADEVPQLLGPNAREHWNSVADTTGYVAAYQVDVDHELSDRLAHIRSSGVPEVWATVEIAGDEEHRTLAAACALRTSQSPSGSAPLPGLIRQAGDQRPALLRLHPLSNRPLDGHAEASAADIAALAWPVIAATATATVSRT